jgi:ABC-type multidrug transport system fused ATPase/permease subunit
MRLSMDVNINKPFSVCFKIFKVFGLWMDGEESRRYRIYGRSLIILVIPSVLYLYFSEIYKKGMTLEMTEYFAFSLTAIVLALRILHFIIQVKKIKLFHEHLNETMKTQVKNVEFIRKRMNLCYKMLVFIALNVLMSLISSFGTFLMLGKLPIPISPPFGIENGPKFLINIFHIYVCGTALYCAPLISLFGFLPIIFMNFTLGIMEDYDERLQKFGQNENGKLEDELIEIVEGNLKIRTLLDEMMTAFNVPIFTNWVTASLSLCLSVFVIPLVN